MRFFPRDEEYFSLFEKAAKNIKEAAYLLRDLVEHFQDVPQKAKKIKDLEHEGDLITHETIAKLNKTFVTPIDREDIHALICAMDDVLDFMEAVADRLALYKVREPTKELVEMVEALVLAAETIDKVVGELHHLKYSQRIIDHCIEINRLENEGDRLLKQGVANLFENERDPIEVIKWKEIYENVEMALDKCEDVANVIEGVMLKHA